MKTKLMERIETKQAVVGVIGLGYVGLPLVLTFARKGFRLVGFDVDTRKVEKLIQGQSYIRHIKSEDIAPHINSGAFQATTDFARISECDALLMCVPTPLNRNREPDMQFVASTADAIAPHLRKDQLVILESTTYPGTTDELVRSRLEGPSGLVAGQDFLLAYSPEREDPGNPNFATAQIPKVVGGLTQACRDTAVALYASAMDKVVPVSSTRAAELTKLLENIFRAVNIALVNELKVLCEAMDIDVWEVIDAAATKPFGYMPFYPGPGLGGHCIPIDPFYLTWKAREYELSTRFIELAGEINTNMPRYVVDRLVAALNDQAKALKGARVLVLGMAYKKNVDDVRESPSLHIVEMLRQRGAVVEYHDPYVPTATVGRAWELNMSSVPLTAETLKAHDVALILTDHTDVDYALVVEHAPLVVDTRNATRRVTSGREKIVRA